MIYTDMESLVAAIANLNLDDKPSVERYRKLIKVYWDAYHNPPEGVIGVGCITYAEEALIDAQLNDPE